MLILYKNATQLVTYDGLALKDVGWAYIGLDEVGGGVLYPLLPLGVCHGGAVLPATHRANTFN